MNKRWGLVVLLGWFFVFKYALPETPGAKAHSRFGPFRTQAICDEWRTEVQTRGQMFEDFTISKCAEEVDV